MEAAAERLEFSFWACAAPATRNFILAAPNTVLGAPVTPLSNRGLSPQARTWGERTIVRYDFKGDKPKRRDKPAVGVRSPPRRRDQPSIIIKIMKQIVAARQNRERDGSTTPSGLGRWRVGGAQLIGLLQQGDDAAGSAQDLVVDPRPDCRQGPVCKPIGIGARLHENLMDPVEAVALLQRL